MKWTFLETQPCNNKSSSKTQPCNNKSRMKQQKPIPPQTQRENIMICTPHLVNSWLSQQTTRPQSLARGPKVLVNLGLPFGTTKDHKTQNETKERTTIKQKQKKTTKTQQNETKERTTIKQKQKKTTKTQQNETKERTTIKQNRKRPKKHNKMKQKKGQQ